jgi:DedD protein
MKFLLVLSDAFDALWAVRGRVAFALAGVALVGVLVAVYLPMIPGNGPPPPPPVAAHSPTVQGPVERARVAPAPIAPNPFPAPAASSPAPVAVATPALAPPAASVADPGVVRAQAPPAPEKVPEAAQATAPTAAPAPAAERMFRVQVGAFREAGRAKALSRRLTRAGFPTSVERGTTADGKTVYRVRTRQALPKGEARQLVARLRHRVPALRPILVPGGETAG